MAAEQYWTRSKRPLSRRRLLAVAGGAAGLSAATLACSGRTRQSAAPAKATAGAPVQGGTFNSFSMLNAALDPQKGSNAGQELASGVLSRPFRFKTAADPKVITSHDLEPDLALSAESPDALTWTLKLRTGARFGNIPPVNGHAVEAEDIKATFTRAVDPATSSPNRGALNMIEPAQIQTPNAQTVVFKLTYPYAPFQKTLASPAYSWILPREALAGAYDPLKQLIGSGPFPLDSFTPDVAYVYKRNPEYFERGRPLVDTMRLAIVPDTAQQMAQFTAGNLDEIVLQSINDVTTLKQRNPNATVLKLDYGSPTPLYLQLGDPSSPFQDIRVRRALSMAIDREAIDKALFNGESQTAPFVPALMGKWAIKFSDLDPTVQQYYKYNPAETKKLLEAAGVSNLQLKLVEVLNGPFTGLYLKQGETIANMLNASGIKTTVVTQDYQQDFVHGGKGSRQGYFDKDMIMLEGVGLLTDADEFVHDNFHTKSSSNAERLSDPALDAMIDKQRTLVNEDERLKAILEIEKYIADKMYVVPTNGSYRFVGIQPRVQEYDWSDTHGKHTETYAKLWLAK
jgi:peptide/nickel transport system substrate-binding protein